MLIPPDWAGIGKLELVNECLDVCAGGELLGFVTAPDANTARVGWYWQTGFVYW